MKAPATFLPASAAFRWATSVCAASASRTAVGACAGRGLGAGPARVAESFLLQPRELVDVLVDKGVAGPAEAVQPVLDVGGIHGLGGLSVVDKVASGAA